MRPLLALALLVLGCSPPAEQKADYDELTGALYSLQSLTPDDARLKASVCSNYEAKAERFRKIRAWRIGAKVDRFVAACSEPKAKKTTGKDE